MVKNTTELTIKLIQIAVIIIILSYFIYRRYKDKIIGFNWFIFLFSAAILQASVEIVLYYLTHVQSIVDPDSALQEIHIIPYAVGIFGLFLYCELILRSKPNEWLLGIATTLLGGYFAVYFLELGFNLESSIPPEHRIYRVIFDIFQFFVISEALYMFVQDAIHVEYKKLKNISIMISIALGIGWIFAGFEIFERWLPWSIYGAIPFGILFGILAIEFIANPFFVYLLPTKLQKIIVIDESGLLLYAVRVGKEEPDIMEHTLLSGTLTAMKQLLTETTGTKSELRKVSFHDKYLIVAESEEKNVSTIVISDRDSFMLQTAANQFIDAFCEKYGLNLAQFDGSIGAFHDATDLVRKIFPFVPPKELFQEDKDSI